MTKKLSKAIMKRSQLEKYFHKKLTDKARMAYKKQKNYVSRLYKKERKSFYGNLNLSILSDNKLFWKTVKPLISDKSNLGSKIKLVEGNKILDDDQEVAEELNSFFENTVSSLDIIENTDILDDASNFSDPVDKAIFKYKFHPSILAIKNKISFSSKEVTISDAENEISNINHKKATTSNSIPPKVLKLASDSTIESLTKIFNKVLQTGKFPENLKLADITPIFKKKSP